MRTSSWLIHTHTRTHRPTDAGDDNTRRPKLASGKKQMNIWIPQNKSPGIEMLSTFCVNYFLRYYLMMQHLPFVKRVNGTHEWAHSLISSYQLLITAACTNTGGKMKGSHSRAADRCPFVPRHSLSQVTSFMQLGMLCLHGQWPLFSIPAESVPGYHVWCKFGDSRSNLWRVIMHIKCR